MCGLFYKHTIFLAWMMDSATYRMWYNQFSIKMVQFIIYINSRNKKFILFELRLPRQNIN